MCRSALTLVDELKPLCSADRLMARSFLYSLTFNQLPRVVEARVGHPAEVARALEYHMPKGTISKQTVTN